MRFLISFFILFLYLASNFYSQGKDCLFPTKAIFSGISSYDGNTASYQYATIGDGQYNYFATGAAPGNGTAYSLASQNDPLILNVDYSVDINHLLTSATSYSGISCGDGYTPDVVHPKDILTTSIDTVSCDTLYQVTRNYLFLSSKIAFDTGKYYITHCYAQPNSYYILGIIYEACGNLADEGDTLWAQLRAWYKSVAYLNPSKTYYCGDLDEYAQTFSHRDELGHPADFKTAISITRFLADSLKCYGPGYVTDYINEYHSYWKDTVKDSTKTPFDSSTFTLDQMGQGFIRGFENQNGVNSIGIIGTNLIGDFSAVQNPFADEVVLRYELNRENLTRIEIYDVLGREMWSDGQGYHSAGSESVKIDTRGWQAGTYYARLLTFSNETKTIVLKLMR